MCVHNIITWRNGQIAQHIFKELGEFDIMSGFTFTPLIAAQAASHWKSSPAHRWVGCSALRTIYQLHIGSAWYECEHLDTLAQSHTQPCVHAIEKLSDGPPLWLPYNFPHISKFLTKLACMQNILSQGTAYSQFVSLCTGFRKGGNKSIHGWYIHWILAYQNMFTYTWIKYYIWKNFGCIFHKTMNLVIPTSQKMVVEIKWDSIFKMNVKNPLDINLFHPLFPSLSCSVWGLRVYLSLMWFDGHDDTLHLYNTL